MASVYRRPGTRFFWVAYQGVDGKRRYESTGTESAEEALQIGDLLERQVAAEKATGADGSGPLTFRRYALGTWIPARVDRGVRSADADEDRIAHALPILGDLELKAVRPRHIDALMAAMRRGGITSKGRGRKGEKLAPRTQRHVYFAVAGVFRDAVRAELVDRSPCVLGRGEVPGKVDADPTWRRTAIFARGEVEQLLSDARIPQYRRVLYGFLFLAGLRINEATPRRWRDYDARAEPLGRLHLETHYILKARRVLDGTKTGHGRDVPVHPTLAKMLAEWRLSGWAARHGQAPGQDDLIVPGRLGKTLNSNSSLLRLHEDLSTLGLRERRQHDARRTFISLGIADGASRDILQWVSHGPRGDVMSLYTSLPWEALCREVAKLNVRLLDGTVTAMRQPPATEGKH